LWNGGIVHGMQIIDQDPEVRRTPLTYYFRSSPIGQLFQALNDHKPPHRVALIGLGAGTLASYAQPGQEFTFFEIDPAVARIAPEAFTYLRDCRGRCQTVLGDGRVALNSADDGQFDLIVCDAFSGDAIPTHLLTVEALRLMARKCSDHGIVAFHLTNLYVDLEPVLARGAHQMGWDCYINHDNRLETLSVEDSRLEKSPSVWAVLARNPADFAGLAKDPRWRPAPADPPAPLWTDDAVSLWPVLHFRPRAQIPAVE
jgi:hypothetical protein